MPAKDFLRMFAYDHWANRECLAAMRAANSVPAAALGRMAHILSAQKLWLERILKQPQSMPVWPSSTLDDCAALADEMSSAWRNYLARLANQFAPGSLDDQVEYRNSKGELWRSRVEDVLTHVLFHSAYHRGQIALQMRASGAEPAYTDFIHAVRKGFVE
ncbi:MAG: DinB family protein [Acidobacteriia bacterium]|nr:DinB family protein [Terriglobia bacterium]